MLREDGSLELYESEAEFQASLPGWAARDRFGIAYRHLERRRARRLSARPFAALHQRHLRAGLEDGRRSRSCSARRSGATPKRAGAALRARRRRPRRCRRATGAMLQLRPGPHRHGRHARDRGGRLVAPAGAAARRPMPLETERGYNTTLPDDRLRREAAARSFPGHGFVITPLDTGLRVGGAVELGGLKLPPNFARVEGDAGARRSASCPASTRRAARNGWAFARRCPNSLPVIGASRAASQRLLCLRPRPSRPDAGRGDGRLGRRSRSRARRRRIDLAPFQPQRF